MTIGIPVESWETIPQEGDEIAAYSEKGMLVGSVTYTGSATALTVWGDDATTEEVEGLLDGEELTFELWRKSEDRIEVLEARIGLKEVMYILKMEFLLPEVLQLW